MAVLADGQCAISGWRLAQSEYLGGDDCTIADMAVWPWHGTLVMGQSMRQMSPRKCKTRFKKLSPAARVEQCQLIKKYPLKHHQSNTNDKTANPKHPELARSALSLAASASAQQR